jgi:hypothetical protein
LRSYLEENLKRKNQVFFWSGFKPNLVNCIIDLKGIKTEAIGTIVQNLGWQDGFKENEFWTLVSFLYGYAVGDLYHRRHLPKSSTVYVAIGKRFTGVESSFWIYEHQTLMNIAADLKIKILCQNGIEFERKIKSLTIEEIEEFCDVDTKANIKIKKLNKNKEN